MEVWRATIGQFLHVGSALVTQTDRPRINRRRAAVAERKDAHLLLSIGFLCSLLLVLAHDVEVNPGPRNAGKR